VPNLPGQLASKFSRDLGSAGTRNEFFRYITTKRLINNTYPSDVYRVRRCEISTDATLRSVQLLTLRCNPTKDSGALVTFLPARLAQKITRARSAIVVQILPSRCDLDTFSVVCRESRAMFCNSNPKEKSRRRSPTGLRPAIRQRQEIGTIV